MIANPAWEEEHQRRPYGRSIDMTLYDFVHKEFLDVPLRSEIKMLDLGCGSGAQTLWLAKLGFDVIGLDCSPTAIARANVKENPFWHVRHRVHDLSEGPLPFRDGSFHLVSDVMGMTCLPKERVSELFGEIRRVLKPWGWVLSMLMSARLPPPSTYFGIDISTIFAQEDVEALAIILKGLFRWTLIDEFNPQNKDGNYIGRWVIISRKGEA